MFLLVHSSYVLAGVIFNSARVVDDVDVEVERYELHKYTTLQYTPYGCTFENASPYKLALSALNINGRSFAEGDTPNLIAPFSSNPLSELLCHYAQEYVDATMLIVNDEGEVSEEHIDIVKVQY